MTASHELASVGRAAQRSIPSFHPLGERTTEGKAYPECLLVDRESALGSSLVHLRSVAAPCQTDVQVRVRPGGDRNIEAARFEAISHEGIFVRAFTASKAQNACMAGPASGSNEVVEYRRSSALPGVEVIAARHSPREWRIIPESYGLVVFRTWHGQTRTRGQLHAAEPPPHAYQLCLRMNHARRLLVEGTPAADVALRCGFADQSHFNRYFKRFFAVTPMRYARPRALSAPSARVPEMPDVPSALLECSDRAPIRP